MSCLTTKKQYILDANVLINGILNPLSYSWKVMDHIRNGDIGGHVLQMTIDEACSVLEKARSRTGIDLASRFKKGISGLPLTQISALTLGEIERYRHIGGACDGAIVAAAVRDNLVICTHDDDFYKQVSEEFTASDPKATVLAARGYEMELYVALPGMLITPSEGTIYIEAQTSWGDFANSKRIGLLWDILDFPGIGVLYLDLGSGDITFDSDGGPSASVSLKDIPCGEQTLKIVVSYNSGSGVCIYRGEGKPRKTSPGSWSPLNPTKPYPIFSGRHGRFEAGVGIRVITGFGKSVSEKAANRMLRGKQPLIPQERITIDEIISFFYTA